MENKRKLVVLGLIKNENEEFLISQRFDPEVPEAHLKWDLIGGTNEFGETLEATVKREILEETGLNVEVQDLMSKSASRTWDHIDHKLHVVVLCFQCKLLSGDMHTNCPKINELKWLKKEALKEYEFLPTAQEFIDSID
jgi:mutator protein MutT